MGQSDNYLAEFDVSKTLFGGFLKKITKSARHILIVLWVIIRYQEIKQQVAKGDKTGITPRIVFIGGMSRPGDETHL